MGSSQLCTEDAVYWPVGGNEWEEGGSRGGCETSVKGGTLEKEKRKAFSRFGYMPLNS